MLTGLKVILIGSDKMVAATDLLDVGLYSPSEAALYARVKTNLMNRWIFGTKQGSSVILPQLGPPENSEEKDVTFLDFVQTLAIRRIRLEHPGIPLQAIRNAYFRAKEYYKVPYPFALSNTRIGLFGPPEDPKRQVIWLCLEENEEGVKKYFQLTGKKYNNQMIGEVVRTYAHRLVFDDTTKLACKYIAYPTTRNAEEVIVMDPKFRFGEPFFESCGYTARTLFDAYRSEGSPERVAAIYGVKPEQVELAIEYFDYLRPSAA
ncbi:MAG: DUF433 domain-containing protein [Pirellulales bacterium]|nr:DUF433 domain-containing protein [Pirellulales bacterium]